MIKLQGLTKDYARQKALRGIDLDVAPGEVFALLGPNGAGKTTTVGILSGLVAPTGGDAYVDGLHVVHRAVQAKRRCGLVPQAVNLDLELSVAENLDFHARLHGMPSALRKSRRLELLDLVSMADRADTRIDQLSGGMKRRAMVARALMHNPAVLLLDEPTAGLDPEIRKRMWSMIMGLRAQGTTILLTTHYIEEAEYLADQVAFLQQGEIVKLGTPKEIMAEVGRWAVDVVREKDVSSSYFESRREAEEYLLSCGGARTVRQVCLEDAYLSITRGGVA